MKLQGEFDVYVIDIAATVEGRVLRPRVYAWTCPHCYRDFLYLTSEQLLYTIKEHLKKHERGEGR